MTHASEIDLARSIPCMLFWEDCEYLYELAQVGGNLVELGCWKGCSTAIILQATQPFGGHLTSVDCFVPFPGNHWEAATADEWRDQLLGIGLTPPELLEMTSQKASAKYYNWIDFLFIDASHGYEQVLNDLELWTPKVKVGGRLAMHDYGSHPGVRLAADEWLAKEKGWERIGLKGIVLGLRKNDP